MARLRKNWKSFFFNMEDDPPSAEEVKRKEEIRSNRRIAKSLRGRLRNLVDYGMRLHPLRSLVGCSLDDLRVHIEKQFSEGMTWKNKGKWHIDHIRPCASFDLTDPEQQKQCFHFSNLQPLWARDNLRKAARYEPQEIRSLSAQG